MLTRLILCFAALLSLSGCGLSYLVQAANGQMRLMSARRPIDEVIADPASSPQLRERLSLVREIRDFASRELALPDNASYRSFADLERPYALWNVVAAPELSVQPRQWCFPIAGCVAYRGYFKEKSARAFAEESRRRGDDVLVGGVVAYSTLGRTADPVLNTMLIYGEDDLAGVLFHELAHQVAYLPGDSSFNEAFAVVVEEAGLARWLAARGRPADLHRWRERLARRKTFAMLFAQRREELRALYRMPMPAPDMQLAKARIMDALVVDIRRLEREHGVRSGYGAWIEEGFNNAHLASVATYYERIPEFEALLAAAGGDLPRFYAVVRERARAAREK